MGAVGLRLAAPMSLSSLPPARGLRRPAGPAASALLVVSLPWAALLAGCGDSNSSDAFDVQVTAYVGQASPLDTVTEGRAVFLVDEGAQAGGVDLNGDGDQEDEVAVTLEFASGVITELGAAPLAVAIVSGAVYLAVDEAQDVDWNGNDLDERVLLRWTSAAPELQFLETLDPDSPVPLVAAGGRLWFLAAEDSLEPDQTNLRFIAQAASPVTVSTDGRTLGAGRVELIGAEGGLLLVRVDETDPSSAGDANGDFDTEDGAVLALLEAAAAEPRLVNTALALPSPTAPVAVAARGGGRFDLALLVSEADQGGVNLNGGAPALPAVCTVGPDVDTEDAVLHLLVFQDGAVESVTNTTLAGADRVFLTDEVLGTLVPEAAVGDGGCDLDLDGLTDHRVLRFAPLDLAEQPLDLSSLYLEVVHDLPGGAFGVAHGTRRVYAALERTFDVGGTPQTLPFLGELDPLDDTQWQFDFEDPDQDVDALRLGLAWLRPEAQSARVRCGLLEQSLGQNLNLTCGAELKDGGSADVTDTILAWVRQTSGGGPSLAAGLGLAIDPTDTGAQLRFGQALFRVSEALDGKDWNADGDLDDHHLFRSSLTACTVERMSSLAPAPAPVLVTDGVRGALFYVDEALAQADLNGDGAIGGLAVRWFRNF
jgi:hypothetical protein